MRAADPAAAHVLLLLLLLCMCAVCETSVLRAFCSVLILYFFVTFLFVLAWLQAEARESAQGKLNASYRGSDEFSTRRVTLITDPAVENS